MCAQKQTRAQRRRYRWHRGHCDRAGLHRLRGDQACRARWEHHHVNAAHDAAMPDAQGQPGGCTSWSLLRMTVEGGGDFRNWPFYGFWQGPIGQSALCFSLGGPYFLSRAASASCFCRKASYSGVPSTIETVSAPASSSFRGSLPHPTHPLCTLRVRRHRRLTQHSLPGGPLRPYLGRTCTG